MATCRATHRPPLRHALSGAFKLTTPRHLVLLPRPAQTSTALSAPRSLGLTAYRAPSPRSLTAYHTTTKLLSTTSAPSPLAADPNLPAYQPPKTGLLSFLPASWVPYAELTRIDKPTGAYYLYFPCVFSTLLAAPLATPIAAPSAVLGTSLLFLTGAVIMRGAGCTINDLWDRNLDPHVARTRLRPLARGAVTPFQAIVFTGGQLLAGLAVLLQFPWECFFYATPSLLFVATYPLAKRVTYYPQFVLGLTFSWGAIMGFPALGVDLLTDAPAQAAAALLYLSNVAWTVLYDMIYAHMDVRDDVKAGIKSIALKHGARTKQVLTGLALVQVGLLAGAGAAVGAGPAFYIGSCGGALVTLGVMIRRVNLKSVSDCWWWFVNGCWITGGVITAGLAADYLVKYVGREERDQAGASTELKAEAS
ncbi:hypothetical protein VTJ83DRAFT_6436 [Remersonia thermophila]|uniref:4-hydroxybenzoate polyprenyltransferase, mitochondrial n=1 Tax=Remersonia thermophila TaxID=72144 RepID=A0ABR4D4P8_9PEZI